jgi:hypothetical protein
VTITFAWDHTPSADDLEEWGFTMFGMALDRALHEAFIYRAAIETLRGLEAEGAIERSGIAEDGDWYFRSTSKSVDGEDGPVPTGRGGVISLAVMGARRRRRRGCGRKAVRAFK